jgi:hypothetical protein
MKVRLLHLEDNGDDVELVRAALAREGLDCDILAVDSGAAFLGEALSAAREPFPPPYSAPRRAPLYGPGAVFSWGSAGDGAVLQSTHAPSPLTERPSRKTPAWPFSHRFTLQSQTGSAGLSTRPRLLKSRRGPPYGHNSMF